MTATVVTAEVLVVMRDVKLAKRALSGDVASAIEWLERFGGAAWRDDVVVSRHASRNGGARPRPAELLGTPEDR